MRAARPAAVVVVCLSLAGCGSGGFGGVYGLTLPGGADLGSHPYQVTAQFANVHDLVPQAAVKVNDVAVGRVSKITLPRNGWTANVVMLVNGKVHLPADAYARLAQSSLLGEKYIELSTPSGGGSGTLADGAVIPMARTDRDPEIEEVFGALSLLLNGGGLSQLRTITQEMNKALGGNEPQVRSMLGRLNTLVSNLNDHRKDITDAIDALDRLSATLASRKEQIGTVLDDLGPGLDVLEQQRGALVTMLRSLEELSGVAVTTINKSKADMVADLQALAPVLANLSDAGRNLPKSLQVLLTYPFTDEVLNGVKGDYLNVYLSVTAPPGTEVIPPIVPAEEEQAKSSGRKGQIAPLPLPLPPVGGARTTPTGSPPATSPSTPASPSGSVPPGTPTATPSSSPNGGG
ncbi:MCE family protein [Actinoallomurus sp. CA-142502]|uniref:MCE family protein n=1 Tax=Actinoallomurus sp. CA-142502 TaxID=3239885 RepID=UPI003D89E03C